MNASMANLRTAFEAAGFTNVRTVLSSGNVVFDARAASDTAIARKAERAMSSQLGHTFVGGAQHGDERILLGARRPVILASP